MRDMLAWDNKSRFQHAYVEVMRRNRKFTREAATNAAILNISHLTLRTLRGGAACAGGLDGRWLRQTAREPASHAGLPSNDAPALVILGLGRHLRPRARRARPSRVEGLGLGKLSGVEIVGCESHCIAARLETQCSRRAEGSMATQYDQTTTIDAHQDVTGSGSGGEATSSAAAQVRAMVAQGHGPAEIGGVLAANPGARDEILRYLHQTRGNAFVQQVMFLGSGGGGGGGGQPQGQPTGAGGGTNQPNGPLAQPPVMLADAPTPVKHDDPLVGGPNMISLVLPVDDQYVQVYVSPGGINHKPDVFMFFHGQSANLMIDPRLKRQDDDNVSGNDSAGAAVAQAKAKNTIAILPQGVRGGGGSNGGQMPAMMGKGSLPKFLDDILAMLGAKIGLEGDITPTHLSLAGHSAGGYQGIDEALVSAGKYADTISDLTLMDSSYSNTHFEHAQSWMFTHSPGKTIRIVQSQDQLLQSHHQVPDPTPENPKHTKDETGPPHWNAYFGDAALIAAAKQQKMTLNQIQKFDWKKWKSDDDRGNSTKVMQHTQVINADGKVQCDILVMQSELGHHEIRDNVMDDAIDSIGQGPASADDFGKNQIPYYGRDPAAPHFNNREHVPGEPAPKPKAKERKKKTAG